MLNFRLTQQNTLQLFKEMGPHLLHPPPSPQGPGVQGPRVVVLLLRGVEPLLGLAHDLGPPPPEGLPEPEAVQEGPRRLLQLAGERGEPQAVALRKFQLVHRPRMGK